MDLDHLDKRPILVAITGSNGAGKTTFFHAHVAECGLPFINADVLSEELDLPGYEGAALAAALRSAMLKRRESFVFETVFSDPAGEKLAFLREAVEAGYTVVLIYIGIANAAVSEERVAMRVSMGGHDVPPEKIQSRFPRTLENLRSAVRSLPTVLVYDNDDLAHPYEHVATFEHGAPSFVAPSSPAWVRSLLPRP